MRKTTLFLSMLFFSFLSWADSITWMEKAEAESLMNILKNERFLFYYCDCCDLDGAEVVQISSLSIEPSDVVENLFSVKVVGTKVMSFSSDVNGNFSEPSFDNEPFQDWASLNYSMISKQGRGLPLANFLNYKTEDIGSCLNFIYFPNPNDKELFEMLTSFPTFKDYETWYSVNVMPHFSARNLMGEWTVSEICLKYGECKEITPEMGSIKLSFESGGKAIFSAPSEGSHEGNWKLENGILFVTTDDGVTDRFAFQIEQNVLYLRDTKESFDTEADVPFTLMKLKK
ncbi:MAG: hypothetical protein ACKVTZ_08650 [Bacteroidia bacterium]